MYSCKTCVQSVDYAVIGNHLHVRVMVGISLSFDLAHARRSVIVYVITTRGIPTCSSRL